MYNFLSQTKCNIFYYINPSGYSIYILLNVLADRIVIIFPPHQHYSCIGTSRIAIVIIYGVQWNRLDGNCYQLFLSHIV